MKHVKLFEQFINEIVDLVHVYDKSGELLGTGELVKTKGKKSLIRWDGSNEEWIDSNLVKMVESTVSEKREDVGKYNTVKKAMKAIKKEYGPTPTPQSVASFINDNYYDVTEVERGDDDPRANDKIADLIATYKFDIEEWEIAWEDVQNESVVTEAKAANYKMLVDVLLNAKPKLAVYYSPSRNVINVGGVGYSGGDLTSQLKLKSGSAGSVKNEFYHAKENAAETKKQIEKLSKGKIEVQIEAEGTSSELVKYIVK